MTRNFLHSKSTINEQHIIVQSGGNSEMLLLLIQCCCCCCFYLNCCCCSCCYCCCCWKCLTGPCSSRFGRATRQSKCAVVPTWAKMSVLLTPTKKSEIRWFSIFVVELRDDPDDFDRSASCSPWGRIRPVELTGKKIEKEKLKSRNLDMKIFKSKL